MNHHNVLPFRLVSPVDSQQLLITSRPIKKILIKRTQKSRPPVHTTLARCLSPQIPDITSKFNSLSPSAQRNLNNLRKMSFSPTPKISQKISENPRKLSKIQSINIPNSDRNNEFYIEKNNFLYGTIRECIGEIPSSQEFCSMMVDEEKIFMQGIRGNSCAIYELEPSCDHWRAVVALDAPGARAGFSVVYYKKKVFLYGGARASGSLSLQKRSSHKIYIYNISSAKWKKVLGSGAIPTARKHHCSTIISHFMFAYGGVSNKSTILSDLCILNLDTQEWIIPSVTIAQDPGKVSHSTFNAVFTSQDLNLNSVFDLPSINNSGCYLFGGLFEGKASNQMYVLTLKDSCLLWSLVNSGGEVPLPRHSHSACVVKSKLFIFGGRNDDLFKSIELVDLHIFNTLTVDWEKVDYSGARLLPRWGHAMAAQANKIFIFGGISYKSYLENNLYCIETWDKSVNKK